MRSVAEVWAKSRMRAPGPRTRDRLLHDSGRRGRDDHQIRSAAFGEPLGLRRRRPWRAGPRPVPRRSAPETARRSAMVSVAAMRAPVRFTSMVNIRPIGPCPITTTKSSGCGIALDHRLQTGVQRLHQGGALERDAVRDLLHAALHNPVHHPHVLGKAAARRFESRGDSHFLINRALRV